MFYQFHRCGLIGMNVMQIKKGLLIWWGGLLMSTHFYSCRHLLGLQVQRFLEQQQVSLKWITQGLSNSGRKNKMHFNPVLVLNHFVAPGVAEPSTIAIPLKQPCNYDIESILCPQHTQYTCQKYRCTSSAKR
jgi:hypothetical protein